MPSTIDNITFQAQQGSVAAIIQLLNQHFAASGIRTRAVLDQGVLQLLCEAPTAAHLPKKRAIERVRTLLEGLSPRGISQVHIHGRIVKEQQLLWLDEIKQDPARSVLWSERITLKTLNPVARLWRDLRTSRGQTALGEVPGLKSSRETGGQRRLGAVGLVLTLVALGGWLGQRWLQDPTGKDVAVTAASPTPPAETPSGPTEATQAADPFAQAVWIAQEAAQDGQTAATTADWLDLASRWQRAAELMAQVPSDDPRYATAQGRVGLYSQNSQTALAQAEQ